MIIAVLGAGTWGIALARLLCNSGHAATVWSAIPEEIEELNTLRRHRNLPEMEIPAAITFTADIEKACCGRDVIVFAVPSVFVRVTARKASPFIGKGQIIVDVAKGIEADTFLTMTEIIREEIPQAGVAALSGPTHAEEVAKDLPTTIVSACEDLSVARFVQSVFNNSVLRVYTNTDVKGVELCGALKNIIALATGIADGLGFGDNTKAALITRGLAEIERLGLKMGCVPATFSGLAGMGDLIVTATSRHSRNGRCGYLIGRGLSPEEAKKQVGMVVEGINALPAAVGLSKKYGVEMPITVTVDDILSGRMNAKDAVQHLMGRSYKDEVTLPEESQAKCGGAEKK